MLKYTIHQYQTFDIKNNFAMFLDYDEPYIVALLGESVEIRTVEPSLRVQNMALAKGARLVTRCRQGQLYAASQGEVWSLQAIPLAQQIHRLLENKQFELALKLTVCTQLFSISLLLQCYLCYSVYIF